MAAISSFAWNSRIPVVRPANNAAYNGTIAPGDSVEIGYLANHTGDTSAPERYTLNGHACTIGD